MDVLQTFIRDLKAESALSPDILEKLMEGRDWQPRLLAERLAEVPGDARTHRRLVVHADERSEVVLVHLAPGVQTPIHDHDRSSGYVHVASGMIVNRIYRKTVCGTIELEGEQFIPKDHGCRMEEGLIHAMHNPSHVDAYTVHVYAPPFGKARIYEDVPEYIAAFI